MKNLEVRLLREHITECISFMQKSNEVDRRDYKYVKDLIFRMPVEERVNYFSELDKVYNAKIKT